MTLSKFDLEAGTLGAAPAGDSIDGFTNGWVIDTGATAVYDATHAFTGTKSIKVVPTATGHAYGQKLGLATARLALDVAFYWTVAVPSSADFVQVRFQTAAAARVMQLHINTAGKIRFSGAGATSPGLYTGAATVPVNQWSRVKLWVEPGTSTTGKGKFQLWTGTTLVEDFSTTTSDFGTGPIDRLLLGTVGGATATYWIDLYGWDPAATTLLSNLDTNAPPVVSIAGGLEKTAPLSQVTDIPATGTDTDGTIASWAWTQISGPATLPTLNATTATLRVNSPSVQGRYVWRVVATDNLGSTSTPVDVTIYVPGSAVKVIAQRSGTLVAVGAADLPTALGDADAATYGESSTNPTALVDVFDLAPLTVGAVTINGVKAKLSAAGTGSCRVDLVTQADTVTSLGNATASLTTTSEVTVPSFTVPQASIANPNKLALRVTYTAA